MAFPKSVKQLCTPAYIYLLLSVIGIIIAIVQNVGNRGVYCLGSMSVPVPSTIMVFVVKIIGILFWTWILNLMCKDGHKEIAWFLVLLPFVLLFFMMGTAEGFQNLPGICSTTGGCSTASTDNTKCLSSECIAAYAMLKTNPLTDLKSCPSLTQCSDAALSVKQCAQCKQ